MCLLAAKYGHFDLLRWARKNGCEWDSKVCTYAARGGYFQILKWAKFYGCPWDAYTCANAAQSGHLDILKWLRERNNPCPWNDLTTLYSYIGGYHEIVKWASNNGCPLHIMCGAAQVHPNLAQALVVPQLDEQNIIIYTDEDLNRHALRAC